MTWIAKFGNIDTTIHVYYILYILYLIYTILYSFTAQNRYKQYLPRSNMGAVMIKMYTQLTKKRRPSQCKNKAAPSMTQSSSYFRTFRQSSTSG